jgi:hypothetical protein
MAKGSNTDDEWILHFKPAPGSEAPTACRIRRLLKIAGRVLKLRCIGVHGPEHQARDLTNTVFKERETT